MPTICQTLTTIFPHFSDKERKAQRDQVTCSRSQR